MKIAFLAPGNLPIPNICGGAIETLTTYLIEENEKTGKEELVVLENYNDEILKLNEKYKHVSFILYKRQRAAKIWDVLCRFINVLYNGFYASYSSQMLWIKKKLKQENPDVIVVEGQRNFVIGLYGGFKNVIFHLHTDLINNNTRFSNKIIESSSVILAVSEFIANRVRTVKTELSTNVKVLRNTINTNNFIYDKDWRNKIRNQYNIEDKIVAVYCGRISEEKGVLELLKGIKKARKESLVLLLIGAAWFSDNTIDDYGRKVKTFIKENNISVVATGYVKHEDLYKYYSAGDFLVMPSICNEAAGLVLMEGISCGLPVVATNIGGIPEYADKKCSILVSYNEDFVENLSKAILKMCDAEFRAILKEKTEDVAKSYSTEYYYEEFLNLIKSSEQ